MAKLRISGQFLLNRLFGSCRPEPHIRIVSGSYDAAEGVLTLDVDGADIPPGAEEVQALFTSKQLTVEFKPR